MRQQQSPNAWSCLPTAFAVSVGCSVYDLIEHVGHTGSELTWPNLPEPMCRRGFHIQELIVVLHATGYSVTPIERYSQIAPDVNVPPQIIDNRQRFEQVVNTTRGVITGHTHRCGHAVAYDHGHILDPRGSSYRLDDCEANDFTPICTWITRRIK